MRNRDTDYPFRHDSYFYYLTGFNEPEATLVLNASAKEGEPASILFCREKNAERETWEGFRFGPDAARDAFGFDAALPIDALDEEMPRLHRRQARAALRAGHIGRNSMRKCATGSPPVRAQSRSGVLRARQRGAICCRFSTRCAS